MFWVLFFGCGRNDVTSPIHVDTGLKASDSAWRLGDPKSCESPMEGFSRFFESASARGVNHTPEFDSLTLSRTLECYFIPVAMAAQMWICPSIGSLVFHRFSGFPSVLWFSIGLCQ